MKRHVCGLDCLKVKKGRLYHACKVCKHGTVTPIAKSRFAVKGRCPSSPDGRHHRDNQDTCHYCGIQMADGWALGKPSVLTPAQKKCATRFVAEMVREQKQGRWSSRKQAIAVGLAKARARC